MTTSYHLLEFVMVGITNARSRVLRVQKEAPNHLSRAKKIPAGASDSKQLYKHASDYLVRIVLFVSVYITNARADGSARVESNNNNKKKATRKSISTKSTSQTLTLLKNDELSDHSC